MSAARIRSLRLRRRGFSLIEVLVALTILVIGVVGVLKLFPTSLRASSEASLRGKAALLAQMKAEELRRDDTQTAASINAIKLLVDPTVLTPFPEDDRLAFQYHSKSLRFREDSPTEVEDDFGVARVIVRYNPAFRPSSEILYELRFDAGF